MQKSENRKKIKLKMDNAVKKIMKQKNEQTKKKEQEAKDVHETKDQGEEKKNEVQQDDVKLKKKLQK